MVGVFFIYGLAFFALGLSVLVYPKRSSRFGLGEDIRLLASFGIVHGANEWIDMFILATPEWAGFLMPLRAAVLPASFYLLLLFGVKSAVRAGGGASPLLRVLKALPYALPAAFAVAVFLSPDRMLFGDIWARHLLGLPGTLVASYALFGQARGAVGAGAERTAMDLKVAAWTFLAYGFFSGAIVPGADFFIAAFLNYEAFMGATGMPVQVFRAVCAVLIAYRMVRVLGMFEQEKLDALRDARDGLARKVRERTSELVRLNEELEQEIAERRGAEVRLKSSLDEKEVLLREIHHRVKNNLQLMISLFNLGARHIKEEEGARYFAESRDRIKSMALIHDKLYASGRLDALDSEDYVRELARRLFRAFGVDTDRVSLDLDVGPGPLGMDAAIPCGLIINELLTNSLKYAFPGGRSGRIRVSLKRQGEDGLVLTVGDDGVGIPEGVDLNEPESLGLEIVSMLAEGQLHGDLEMKSNGGTEFTIRFREPKYQRRV